LKPNAPNRSFALRRTICDVRKTAK
jgi:hypothetical protein